MSDPIIFRIPANTTGAFGLALVDKAAVGYSEAWQAPMGKVLPTVALADYEADSDSWVCQITNSALVTTPNIESTTRKATFCALAAETQVPQESTFEIEIGYFQDINRNDVVASAGGLSLWLFENRNKECYVYFGADGDDAPRMIGRCLVSPGNIGGDAQTDLEATATFPLMRAPDIEGGSGAVTRIVTGAGSGAGTMATATAKIGDEEGCGLGGGMNDGRCLGHGVDVGS